MKKFWTGALLGVTVSGFSGCFTVDDALRAAINANTNQSAPTPQPPPPAPPPTTPSPVESSASSSPWAQPEALYGIFAMAYTNMGFMYGSTELKAGEYIRLGSQNAGDDSHRGPAWFERAHLKDVAEGQWWRIKFAGEQNESIIVEALVSSGQQKLVRMRAKLPGEAAARDIPVDSMEPIPPTRSVSPKQVGAVDAGVESVSTAAGSFSAHHYTIQHGGDGMDWWVSDTIPGGLVKMTGKSRGGSLELQAYGDNATTELASF